MNSPDDEQALPRALTTQEIAVVTWLLENASVMGSLQHLLTGIDQLHVVDRCECGCASVDFEIGGQSGRSHRIADAIAETPAGLKCGVILWGRADAVTGLEVYDLDPGSSSELPPLATLRPWQ